MLLFLLQKSTNKILPTYQSISYIGGIHVVVKHSLFVYFPPKWFIAKSVFQSVSFTKNNVCHMLSTKRQAYTICNRFFWNCKIFIYLFVFIFMFFNNKNLVIVVYVTFYEKLIFTNFFFIVSLCLGHFNY